MSQLSAAISFVLSHLYNKLPRRRVDNFGEQLEKELMKRLALNLGRGKEAYSVAVSGVGVDEAVVQATKDCGLSLQELQTYLPADLVVTFHAGGQVTCTVAQGPVKTLLSPAVDPVAPDAPALPPVDLLAQSLNHVVLQDFLQHQPNLPPPLLPMFGLPRPAQPPARYDSVLPNQCRGSVSRPTNMITIAEFAQTKFGSTKLKSNRQRRSGRDVDGGRRSGYNRGGQGAQREKAAVSGPSAVVGRVTPSQSVSEGAGDTAAGWLPGGTSWPEGAQRAASDIGSSILSTPSPSSSEFSSHSDDWAGGSGSAQRVPRPSSHWAITPDEASLLWANATNTRACPAAFGRSILAN